MIIKEVFYAAMHKALKARKIPKSERDYAIAVSWNLCESGIENADDIIEYNESLARDFIKQSRVVVPTEHKEQCDFVEWFRKTYRVFIYAIPNGAGLINGGSQWQYLECEGAVRGVADLHIPEWKVWVEMKKIKGGEWLDSQKKFKKRIEAIGHTYILALGFEDAKRQILEFWEKCNE